MTIVRTTLIAILLLNCTPVFASTSALVYLQQIGNQTTSPDSIGHLDVAMQMAQLIQQQASLAVQQTDLSLIKYHNRHIAIALQGRRTGAVANSGLIQASKGIISLVNLAAMASDAVPEIRRHFVHIATSATNTLALAVTMLNISRQLASTTSMARALSLASQLQDFADILLPGTDSNGDGKITWIKYEGGLLHCQKHLQLLRAEINL
ncbi:MAG: hypothetical protein OFPI_07070 [Osedax symbiont Rs2]|nr:MAG: hypothetical protein OFPI_07070 [Osedax symbiont Rs2]